MQKLVKLEFNVLKMRSSLVFFGLLFYFIFIANKIFSKIYFN